MVRELTPAEKREYWVARLMAHLPIPWAAAIGSYMGERAVRAAIRDNLDWIQKMHCNLESLLEIGDRQEREQWIINWTRRVGRMHSEYTLIPRLIKDKRIEVLGKENLDGLDKSVIFVSCHSGNWELVGHVLWSLPRPIAALYATPENPVHQTIAIQVRKDWVDHTELIPASSRAMFQLVRALNRGNHLLLFIDEEKNGEILAPSLGRDLPYAGNRWLAARLAIKYNIDIFPIYVEEIDNSRYRVVIEQKLNHGSGPREKRARYLADQLDKRLDCWIREHLEQWYWLGTLDLNKTLPSK